MNRTGGSRSADSGYAENRLAIARSFQATAETAFALADKGDAMNAVISSIVLAAIAYSDSLTARFAGAINQRDHAALTALLRQALGNKLPKSMETSLGRILSVKDDVQYGSRPSTRNEGEKLLLQLRSFAAWAEEMLASSS